MPIQVGSLFDPADPDWHVEEPAHQPIPLETANYCNPARQYRRWADSLLAQMPANPSREQVSYYAAELTRSWFERRRGAGRAHQGFGSPSGRHVCLGNVLADTYGRLYDAYINCPPQPPKRMRQDRGPTPVVDSLAFGIKEEPADAAAP
jgi:hypothetical protein